MIDDEGDGVEDHRASEIVGVEIPSHREKAGEQDGQVKESGGGRRGMALWHACEGRPTCRG